MKVFIVVLIILASILLLTAITALTANFFFNKKVAREITELYDTVSLKGLEIIEEQSLGGLPAPVKRWLEYSGVIGKERTMTVHLKQSATMRLKEDQAWITNAADEYFRVDEPGFIWKAYIRVPPFLHIVGRDSYSGGEGRMLIKLLSLISVVDAEGPEIDQGALLRFLGEAVWFPSAALCDYIVWEDIDDDSARAIMSYGKVSASGVFTFNAHGEVVNFTADRYYEQGGTYTLEPWSIDLYEYRSFEGIKIPTRGEVTWKLETGDFTWFRFEITDVEYNEESVD